MSDWQTHAACAGMNPALFFPNREQQMRDSSR